MNNETKNSSNLKVIHEENGEDESREEEEETDDEYNFEESKNKLYIKSGNADEKEPLV